MAKRIISLLLLVAILMTMLPMAIAAEAKEEDLETKLLRIDKSKAKFGRLSMTQAEETKPVKETKAGNYSVILPYDNMWNQSFVSGQDLYLQFLAIDYGYSYAENFNILIFYGDDLSEENLVFSDWGYYSDLDYMMTILTYELYTTGLPAGDYYVYCYTEYGGSIVGDLYCVPISVTNYTRPLNSINFVDLDTHQPAYAAQIPSGTSKNYFIGYNPYNATSPDRRTTYYCSDPNAFAIEDFAGLITVTAYYCSDAVITATSAGKTATMYVSSHSDYDGNNICDDCAKMLLYDVPQGSWFYDAVEYVVRRGLFNGTAPNKFEPDSSMTRAMVVTVLWRYEGSPYAQSSNFSDVPDGSWYDQAVSWAAYNGVVNGVGNNKFDPDARVTREQLATIIYRYCKQNRIDTFDRMDLSAFPDGGSVSDWSRDALSWSAAVGLIGGMADVAGGPLYLKPTGNATRAQVATILMRFIENVADDLLTDMVAYITDCGSVDDWSYNQSTWEGVVEWCERYDIPCTYYRPSEDSNRARLDAIKQAVSDGATTIVVSSFLFGTALIDAQQLYPEVKFIALDVSESDMTYDYSTYYPPAANTALVLYAEEQAGFMAGYAAVKMGYRSLGFLGGMPVPAVVRYGFGFLQGVDAAAAELGVTDQVQVNYWYSNIFVPTDTVLAKMNGWYADGTQVVFCCGGGIYISCIAAAEAYGGKVIGVDVDQSYESDAVITSAMKGLGFTVEYLLSEIYNYDNWNEYGGKCTTFGAQDGGQNGEGFVMLPENTQFNASFTRNDYIAMWNKIANGTIVVSDNIEAAPSVSIFVDYQ